MSALDAFDRHFCSEWYIAIRQRTIYPCETDGDIKKWETEVTRLFCEDNSAVRDRVNLEFQTWSPYAD